MLLAQYYSNDQIISACRAAANGDRSALIRVYESCKTPEARKCIDQTLADVQKIHDEIKASIAEHLEDHRRDNTDMSRLERGCNG